MRNRNLGIPAKEDGLVGNLLIFDYFWGSQYLVRFEIPVLISPFHALRLVRDRYEIGTRLLRDWSEIGTRWVRDWYEITAQRKKERN